MATSPINSTGLLGSTETAVGTPIAATPQQAQAADTKGDTATLSATAQALALYQQGESVTMISEVMGVNITTVDGYLDIQVQTVPTTQAATASSGTSAVKV